VTFQEAIAACFTKYADFTGRASRPEYWWFFLFLCLAGTAISIVSEELGSLFYLATALPFFAVGARRLHETQRSGWLQFFWCLPVIGWTILIVFLATGYKEPGQAAS
jgi:uncharacterized membrane protein YhaH (DUF805 family)